MFLDFLKERWTILTDFCEKLALKQLSLFPSNVFYKKLLFVLGRQHVTMSLAKKGDVLVSHLSGCLMICDRTDNIQRGIIQKRTFSPEILKTINIFLKPRTTFIDVGAHCGSISIPTAFNNPHSNVLSIEPQYDLLEKLKKNIQINNISNIETYGKAISKKEMEINLKVPIRNDGTLISELAGNLDKRSTLKYKNQIVRTNTLDNILISENHPVSIIKIDVQGNELDVLKGSLNILKKYRPALIIEIEDKFFSNPRKNRAEIAKTFKEFNYKCYLLEDALQGRFLPINLKCPLENDILAISI